MNTYWYNETGKIFKAAYGLPNDEANEQESDGYSLLVSGTRCFPIDDYYINDGELVSKGDAPSLHHIWDWGGFNWIDPRTLDDHKLARMLYLKQCRDDEQFGGFVWDGSMFDSNERSQTVLLGMFTTAVAGALPDTPFRLKDNSWRVLTATDIIGVWGALQLLISTAFGKFGALESTVMNAGTVEAVEAVEWVQG